MLAKRSDGLARDYLRADRRLDHDFEQLARDQLLEFLGDLLPPLERLVPMDDDRERVHRLAIQQHVELDELRRPVLQELVVQGRVAARDRLQLVVEVEDDLREGKLPAELDARRVHVVHSPVHAPPVLPELHHRADVLGRREDARLDVRLFDVVHGRAMRYETRVLHQLHRTVRPVDVVFHVGNGADQVEVKLALEPLPHDLHVEQPEEPAAEAEPERDRRLGLVMQRRVVELQLRERVAQLFELPGVGGIQTREHHRRDVTIARQQRDVAVLGVEHRVPGARFPHPANVGDEVPHFPRLELLGRLVAELQVPHLVDLVHVVAVRAERDPHPGPEHAVDHPDARDGAAIAVVIRVEDEGTKRGVAAPAWRRDPQHHLLEQVGNAGSLLRRDPEDLFGLRADQVAELLRPAVGLRAGQVDLVEHGEDLEPGVEREEQVRDGLRLDALGGVHDKDRSLAGRERARHLVGEIHVAGRVDEVQLVELAVTGVVAHAHCIQLDRDPALALEIHRVEHLLAHEALVERARELDKPVGQGRFPVVDVGHDAEVADVVLAHVGGNIGARCRVSGVGWGA